MAPMRRKSHGSIRSPHVKRNSQSQATFEGWIFKLEGGALKQWKQRWCALVDFCLFFYKAPHEEKVVSSILLPSYKINPCSTDDKISKKFAFKAEHQNMKTYYFATEDKESMKKWMNAMSLATIMQNPSYDDDESGFTSYRSRRDRSSSVPCSSGKQRSSSCGERVSEKYLGSDDKYPAASQSYKAQHRQPLYANAPPKPRRLTQTAIYPDELDPNQYNVDRYSQEENMQYLPVDSEVNNPAYATHYASSYTDAELPVPQVCESSDMYMMKVPRPHSADFLEREPESVVPQYTSQYCQSHQPQRPKSSLEYFNNSADCEDYEFDHYREAVRMQADNFYANKNLIKARNFHESRKSIENVTKSDPRLNAHHNSQSGYISSDSVPSPYHTHSKEHLNEPQYRSDAVNKTFNSPCSNSKSRNNESMQRLLEWKQRMLQSPLSRRNHLQSTSSDTSSKHTDYSRQSLRHFETNKSNYNRSVQENMSYQVKNIPHDRKDAYRSSSNTLDPTHCESSSLYDSEDKVHLLYKNTGRQENPKQLPETREKCNSNQMLTDAADNLYQKNIMYCVDSENNEILFSYDTSPTESTAPTFHGSYYPPQMHSFSTLPNVNDIGVESAQISPYDSHHGKNKHHKTKSIQEVQNSTDVEKGITYTSDDEDEVIEECDLKETFLPSKETAAESQLEEKYFDERYQSSSPDYVNISSMYRDLDPVPTSGVYSSDSAYRSSMPINKAVLKQLKQVSKKIPEQESTLLTSSDSLKNCSSASLDKNITQVSPQIKGKGLVSQSGNIDEVDCDIKREDYYRASQIFYSSMRMKSRLGASPNKNSGITNVSTPESICCSSPQPKLESKPVPKITSLDIDVGLPMPTVKMQTKVDSSPKMPESTSSEISDAKSNTIISKITNVANKFDLKLESSPVIKQPTTDYKEIKKETKTKLSYEEMRGQLLRKREAPPPNIVQERIKKFEKVKVNDENKKNKSLNQSNLLDNTLHTHKFVNRSFSKRSRQKSNRSRCQKRILHSDSEAIAFDDSDASSDDLTMKSAPILLSPLSSVLADLRKTADSNKEKVKENSLGRTVRKDFHFKIDNYIDSRVSSEDKKNNLLDSSIKNYSDLMLQNNEDAVYLPMYGIKAFQEPEYVTMNGSKFSSNAASSSKYNANKHHEEHVYNEPFSPPSSFLHDVYEKQKSKSFQYQIESSSDDSSTENIYEKPTQRFSFDSSRSIKLAQETNFVLMNSSSCSNVASNVTDKKASQNKVHHYEQAHISVSVPDLLQLQEIKDSDASDADDEASRDFDAPLSSYAVHSSSNSTSDGHLICSHKSSSNNSFHSSMPHEKNSSESSSRSNAPFVQSCIEGFRTTSDDSENIIHVRKLRVYTKGKKPEMPRMFPGPFNIEETESPYQKYQSAESFSENVAYISHADIQSNGEDSDASLIVPTTSYAPDIISSIKEETTVNESPYSKSSASAPYYYSDLYSGYGLNFSGQFPMGLPCIDKISPPKSSTSLLNNIRPKSPCANKGDIGRKVNNINIQTKSKPTSVEKPILKSVNDDEVKNNIRHCLDVYRVSESKYLDAEKNKYEAGSTLEKTRTTNAMSYFKHRASTPDLNQPNEPVYENMFFQSKRMSQSLEEISAASRHFNCAENNEFNSRTSPIYENIDFFNRIDEEALRIQHPKQSQYNISRNIGSLNFSNTELSNDNQNALEKQSLPKAQNDTISEITDDHRPAHFLDHDHPNHFLDPDTLRHVDRQHLHPKTSKSFLMNKASKAMCDPVNVAPRPLINFESVEEDCNYKITFNSDTLVPKLKVNDLDSISDATSSFDEASADSDNRHRPVLGKSNLDGFHSCDSGLDVTAKEASHVKKLVQRSHGLMTKGKRLSVSAGDLLGKTHEELVLLLIQLRRNQSKILKTKEKLEYRLKKERSGMLQMKNQSASGQCEELYNQILYLEKNYKMMQPLVTLVDNMIKLGSLYGSSNRRSFSLPTLDRAQDLTPSSPTSNTSLHQTNILSKLLSEGNNLQKHIKEINELEKKFQSETNSLSTLHQDKEMLEHTLFGMRNKILDHQDRPAELQKLRKQQRMIEKELIRVKRLLNSSAKKIEDATSKNDQMEQEILHLRQLLQQALKTGSSETKSSQHNRADLEAELTRLQSVLDELANHRQEINNSVEKLKNEAGGSKGSEVRASPTGVAGSAPLPLRKKHHCMYLETDLDTMVTRDLAVSYEKDLDDIPVYANAEEISLSTDEVTCLSSNDAVTSTSKIDHTDSEFGALQDINEADERMKRFYGILPKEKPCEIKTVRIVKRQSERRSRERDKKRVTYDEQSSVWIMEEPDLSSDDYLENEESGNKKIHVQRPTSINLSSTTSSGLQTSSKSAHERLFGTSVTPKSGTILQKHAVKKPKRRHYTVSGYQYMLDPQFSQYFIERPRSRDDVDMERCLRTANTPDIVRSTIKKKDVFDDTLIDRELGLPQKIEIPERYVEVEPEHLSATERLQRSRKAENICKMLSQTTTSYEDVVEKRNNSPEALHKKLSEEKRKRAQLLSLNQALAREVVERSKAVAANVYPLENQASS